MRIMNDWPSNPVAIRVIPNHKKAVTLGGWIAGRFMRVMASSLIFIATFPLDDVLAQTPPAATTQPATATAAAPAAPLPTAMPAEAGMSAADRRQIQAALLRLGYDPGPVDGSFGSLTRAAIRRFQQGIGAEPTGVITADEASRLVSTPATTQPATAQPFNAEQLDALLASIALYPDELLTQVLMASTFPLEVVAAARWVEDPAHKSLTGDALVKALEAEPWDPSVKSLVPFPAVLATMNNNLSWLQQLGYAFATQQADVFASVQRLRRQAQSNGKLESTPQQVVRVEQVMSEPPLGSSQPPTPQEVVVIQSAQPDTVYVPSYNPARGVRLVVALPVISAVLCGPAAGLLLRHRSCHRARICGRCCDRGRTIGLGEPGVGRRLCQRERQQVQQHQREPGADQFVALGRELCRWATGQLLSRAWRPGRATRPLASLCPGQRGEAAHPCRRRRWHRRCRRSGSARWSRRHRRCWRRRWCWWSGSARRAGRCRRRRRSGSARRTRRRGGRWRSGPPRRPRQRGSSRRSRRRGRCWWRGPAGQSRRCEPWPPGRRVW